MSFSDGIGIDNLQNKFIIEVSMTTSLSDTKSKVLYVDDEDNNLFLFKTTFRKYYEIYTANSAEQGVDILRTQNIKLIITDQRMPGTSGIEFLQKTIEEYPDAVRLILTGNREIGEIINAINHGKIYHFITKPWKVDELKLIMDKALEYYNLKCHNQELIHSLENKNLQLTRAIEELELFLYRSSHDLRGPLATQMGLIRLTRMESGIEHVEEYLSRLEECTYNLASTLDKFSKVNVFNIDEVHFHEVNVNQLLEEIIGNQQHKIEERSISIKVNCKGENKFISNSELVRIVIENLIENAIKFSDSDKENGPFIEIDALQTPSQLTLEFRDNGIGIEDQHMPRIFDPFFKVNRGWGNGLGLYVVQKVLHKLGGTIDFSSEFQKGTSVKLTLPNATMGEAKLRFAC